jgi:hypothetical protein
MSRRHNNSQIHSLIQLSCVLLFCFAFCLPAVSADGPTGKTFRISVDQTMWSKWGFQYPVTYVFDITGLSLGAKVSRRDGSSGAGKVLPKKKAGDFFNGVECTRFDYSGGRAFVSVGFGVSNSIELDFANLTSARFVGVAKYYDDRKAAYTLSLDNWGRRATANPGAAWRAANDDPCDNYQAALRVCHGFHLPVSIAINTHMAGSNAMWNTMQQELDRRDSSWEPAVHAQTHPGNAKGYSVRGCKAEVLGCRDEILQHLHHIPFGEHVFEHILTSGYKDDAILGTDAAEFLFVRGYNGRDNPESTDYATWDAARKFYGVGGLNTKDYDRVFARRTPKGRFFAADVAELNAEFDRVRAAGGICYAMWHPDRYLNNVLHDPRPGKNGAQGSTLVQHLSHVANRKDVWYVANGWLYSYRYVAEHASVTSQQP